MIQIILPNSNPYPSFLGISQRSQAIGAIPFQVQQKNDYCYCAVECDYVETVFAEIGGAEYKNDFSSYLFKKVVDTDVIMFELWKEGVKVADLNNDDYGTYYPTFTNQPLQIGFIVSWEKVFSLLGTGLYQFRANFTVLGDTDTFTSNLFRLYPYSDESANKTVKVIGRQTGNIKGNSLDFTGLLENGWPFYIRVDGELNLVNPEYTQDNYLDSTEKRLQVQDKLVNNYELLIKQSPASIVNLFLKGAISLANSIEITDYNLFNVEIYRDVELYTQDFNYEPVKGQRLQDIIVQFSEKTEGTIKRNF